MTLVAIPNCVIILAPAEAPDMWCVYEHWMTLTDDGAPPSVIFVSACPLRNVFNMTEGRNNSEWTKLAATNRPIMIRIIAITPDHGEARGHAIRHIHSFGEMPRCNLHGFNVFGKGRSIICSNGQEYRNQSEAAKMLGISQSAISEHLNGRLTNVRGFTFAYKDAR